MEKKLHDTFFVQIERTALEKPFIPSHSDGRGFLAKIQIKYHMFLLSYSHYEKEKRIWSFLCEFFVILRIVIIKFFIDERRKKL